MEAKSNHQTSPPGDGRPVQFGLRTLMLFTFVSAVAFGLAQWLELGLAIPIFVLGFGALMALMAGLMTGTSHSMAAIHKTQALDEAILIRDYLRQHKIPATVHEGSLPGFTGMAMHLHEVLVPAHQVDEAQRLIAEKLDQR